MEKDILFGQSVTNGATKMTTKMHSIKTSAMTDKIDHTTSLTTFWDSSASLIFL